MVMLERSWTDDRYCAAISANRSRTMNDDYCCFASPNSAGSCCHRCRIDDRMPSNHPLDQRYSFSCAPFRVQCRATLRVGARSDRGRRSWKENSNSCCSAITTLCSRIHLFSESSHWCRPSWEYYLERAREASGSHSMKFFVWTEKALVRLPNLSHDYHLFGICYNKYICYTPDPRSNRPACWRTASWPCRTRSDSWGMHQLHDYLMRRWKMLARCGRIEAHVLVQLLAGQWVEQLLHDEISHIGLLPDKL